MYLSEEKRAEMRKCLGIQRSNPGLDSEFSSGKNKTNHSQGFHDTAEGRKVSQILFDARDGREEYILYRKALDLDASKLAELVFLI